MRVGFDVVYVAENHENLHHILVFLTVTGGKAGAELQAEVMPPFLNQATEAGDHFMVKSGPHSSLPLMLPAHTPAGKQEIRTQSGHYEIKLTTQSTVLEVESSTSPLMDAAQLLKLNPTSFLCASCSLPLIQSAKVTSYRDLPSEHWEELVEAWMCHSDQKLQDHVQQHGKGGFWPKEGQALVGGSYILFEESAMNKFNLYLADESKVSYQSLVMVFSGQKEDWRWDLTDGCCWLSSNPLQSCSQTSANPYGFCGRLMCLTSSGFD